MTSLIDSLFWDTKPLPTTTEKTIPEKMIWNMVEWTNEMMISLGSIVVFVIIILCLYMLALYHMLAFVFGLIF